MARFPERAPIANPGKHSALAVSLLRRFALPVVRLVHRAKLEGAEHLPEPSPFLLVSNHPSSISASELMSFAALYADRFGDTRPLAGFAHVATFGWWPLGFVFEHIGAIPSTYAAAESALERGVPIFVLPGSDHDGFRPFWKHGKVDFAGRVGFLKIARKAWAPIVPMAFRGIAAPLVLQSRAIAWLLVWPRLIGVKRFGVSMLAVIGVALILAFVPLAWHWRAALAYAWLACPLNLVSWWPATIRITVGKPIAPETLFGDRNDTSDETLRRALVTVEQAVQAALDSK